MLPIAKYLSIALEDIEVIRIALYELTYTGEVLISGVALATLCLLGQEEPERQLFVSLDLLLSIKSEKLGLCRRIVLAEEILMHT